MTAERDPITLVHEAIVAALGPALGPRWRIETIPWPMTVAELGRLLKATPSVGIAFTGFRPGREGRRLAGTVSFAVLVAVKSDKGPARLLGDGASAGLYRGLMAVAAAVHGVTVTDLGTLQAGEIVPSYSDGYSALDLAMGVVPVSCNVIVGDVLGWADGLDDLAALETTWTTAPDAPTDDIDVPQDAVEGGA